MKAVGVDQQALDHPLATAIGYHSPGPLLPDVCAEYEAETGRSVKEDFPDWEPCHNILLGNHVMGFENVGGDIDEVLGQRVILAGFPIRWVGAMVPWSEWSPSSRSDRFSVELSAGAASCWPSSMGAVTLRRVAGQ